MPLLHKDFSCTDVKAGDIIGTGKSIDEATILSGPSCAQVQEQLKPVTSQSDNETGGSDVDRKS